jgi:hypothetical protein
MKQLRAEVELKGSGGILDLFDNVIKQLFNSTDEEYDFIAENANDEELQAFVAALGENKEKPSFAERRAALEVRDKYLTIYNSQN